MPERWQLEVKKLDGLEMPATVRERMERGPTGDRLPPRRDRVLAAVVAFAVFAAAGFLVWTAFRPTRAVVGGESTPQVIVTFTTTGPESELPTAILVLGDETVKGTEGSYCWNGTTKCVDTVAPEFTDFLVIPRGTELVVRGTAESVDGSLGKTWDQPGVKLDLVRGSATLDAEPAKYVLSFVAHWPQGDVPFFFPIEIVPRTEAEPSFSASRNEPQEIAHGEEAGQLWTIAVRPYDTGWCLSFSYAGEGPRGGCGTDLGDKVFGGAGSGGGLSWSAHTGLSTAPRDLEGYVTTRAASVEYQLVGGRTIAASLYPLPTDAFGGGAQAYILFVPNDALIQAGDLVAYNAQGTELGRQYLDFSPVTLYPAILKASSPEAVDAMKALQLAGAVAARYFYDHDSWDGFDPASAVQISDALTYNTSSTAVVGEVSLRVAGKDSLVLATKVSNGDVYSACFQSGPSRVTHGRNDTSDPSACSNGWLNSP